MAKRKAPKSPKNAAREFYDRRRTGIDRKVRSLITGESNDYGVEMNVTIIYEYANEVSFFRSHVNEESARWFSSFAELVSVSYKQEIVQDCKTLTCYRRMPVSREKIRIWDVLTRQHLSL
jgi:hypothetical protein